MQYKRRTRAPSKSGERKEDNDEEKQEENCAAGKASLYVSPAYCHAGEKVSKARRPSRPVFKGRGELRYTAKFTSRKKL